MLKIIQKRGQNLQTTINKYSLFGHYPLPCTWYMWWLHMATELFLSAIFTSFHRVLLYLYTLMQFIYVHRMFIRSFTQVLVNRRKYKDSIKQLIGVRSYYHPLWCRDRIFSQISYLIWLYSLLYFTGYLEEFIYNSLLLYLYINF